MKNENNMFLGELFLTLKRKIEGKDKDEAYKLCEAFFKKCEEKKTHYYAAPLLLSLQKELKIEGSVFEKCNRIEQKKHNLRNKELKLQSKANRNNTVFKYFIVISIILQILYFMFVDKFDIFPFI